MLRKKLLALGIVLVSLSALAQTRSLTAHAIVPTPLECSTQPGAFVLKNKMIIGVSDPSLLPAARYLQGILSKVVQTSVVSKVAQVDICLKLNPSESKAGSYRLTVSPRLISIDGHDYSGIISGISSLHQLLPVEMEQAQAKAKQWTVPAVKIADAPRFDWRGLMLDSSRHFWKPSEVKRVLDLMALYKLNKFHWHLTDDQGWRIEIKKYPLLTQKGAWRKFNTHDLGCIDLAQKNDNSDYLIPADKLKINGNDTLYGGYYTQGEIKEIVAYAAQRGIDVIPEIDMPGHFLAAITQYPDVACDGLVGWGSSFSSPICPGKDSSMEFCKNVYKEVFALFPYHYVHLGGDEVEKGNWEKCPACQERIKKENLASTEKLQAWFVCQMEKFFLENGKQLIGWDEVVEDGLSSKAAIMWWRGWSPNAVPLATSEGKEAICSPNTSCYFDYQQDKNSLKQVLEHEPFTDKLNVAQRKLIKGVQANLWTEWIPSMKRVEYMLMPRLMALSEVGWAKPELKPSIDEFYKKLPLQLKRMDKMGINYRIPDLYGFYEVNAFVGQTDLVVKSLLPGAIIRYTTDGQMPNLSSPVYTGHLKLTKTTDLTFRTFRPDGSPSDVVKARFVKSDFAPAVEAAGNLNSGLNVVWHDYKGKACAEIDNAPVKGQYHVQRVSIPDGVKGNIGLIVKGYLQVPADGIYTFALTSDDGSVMNLDGELLVDNDGAHSPKEVIAQKALKKGLHPLEIRYFDSNGGLLKLELINSKGEREPLEGQWLVH